MNIELQVKNLFANASQLDEAGFIADFYYIAKDFARQQNGAKPDVSGSLPPKAEIESVLRDVYDDTLSKWSSHLEVDAGISKYASQIIDLFRRQ